MRQSEVDRSSAALCSSHCRSGIDILPFQVSYSVSLQPFDDVDLLQLATFVILHMNVQNETDDRLSVFSRRCFQAL